MEIKKEKYKLQAFADDLIFILQDPQETGSKLIKKIEEYGEMAGFKINREKIKILVKNITEKQKKELTKILDIQITKKVKYLGIQLTARCVTIKEDNYYNLLQQTKIDLKKWNISIIFKRKNSYN
uniref:Reverse transcriptase domain-containing protein n=1 Tax=Micrurus surinamensis TaxID=129470 RepID=A0A2D4PAM0_MICSU